jgi:uncharacterized membrane protein
MSAPAHKTHKPAFVSLAPEQSFRWRAGEITRLEAFCDVVFGFAITLLVVSLEVPKSYEELMSAVRGFVPFAVCFAQIILIWITHYRFSRRYGLQDPWTVFLNIVLLFLVLFYVYPLKFVFTMLFDELTGLRSVEALDAHQASVLMRLYAVGFASVFALFALMYRHAYHWRERLKLDALETLETGVSLQEAVALTLIGVLSFAITFRSPAWAGWVYALIGPFYFVHGTIMGKKLRLLRQKHAPVMN